MTFKKSIALLLVVMLFSASMAFAATSTSGKSNGGTQGTCTCTGKFTLINGDTVDSATAKTTSGAKGKLSVLAKIYWSNGETTVNRSRDKTSDTSSTSVSVTVKADNKFGTSGLGAHAYTSSDYGTWYGTTSDKY